MILAGDIGGTNSRLALYSPDGRRVVRLEKFESRAHTSLESVVRAFVGKRPPKITAACFGVAGPVIGQRCTATNLPWVIDARSLARRLKIKRVTLINDLVALALGALTVRSGKLHPLRGGELPKKRGANLAILAAGTGLGEAALLWDGLRFVPCATEGGHVDFAPRSQVEWDLLTFLQKKFGRVSYERVLSGPGLGNLYDFFRDGKKMRETARAESRIVGARDRNHEIVELALSGDSEVAVKTVELFVSIYGAEAGNMCLRTLATGGLFVAGSIAGSLVKFLENGDFLKSFGAKGRLSPLLADIPIALVKDTEIGIAGSAYHATHR
ncbi:MAG: glucokinase [Polyangiaceae bacterium]